MGAEPVVVEKFKFQIPEGTEGKARQAAFDRIKAAHASDPQTTEAALQHHLAPATSQFDLARVDFGISPHTGKLKLK